MSFSVSLSKCLSPDTQTRSEGEAFLHQKCSENFGDCLMEIANILINEGLNFSLRQLCATLIKNLLNQSQYQGKWEALPKNTRDEIKNKILACLASTSHEICSLTALAIASICRRDIPSGNWNEIVNILFSTSQNPNPSYRLSSIITIGYIAQDLKDGDLTQDQVNLFLSALIQNLTPGNEQLFKFATISFANFLIFAKHNFANPDERKIILDKIISLIKDPSVSNEIRVYLLQALIEIIRLYYICIVDRMSEITTLTCLYIKSQERLIAIPAIEFWCSLCEEEISRIKLRPETCMYISKKYHEELFNVIQEVLITRNEKEKIDQEDEWTPLKGVVCLMENMAQCCGNEYLNNVLGFVGKYLHNANTHLKDSAYLSFGSILSSSSIGEEILRSSVPQLLEQILKENDLKLMRTIAWCFCQLCEFHASVFNDQILFNSTIDLIIKIIQIHSTKNMLLIKICEALHHMIIGIADKRYLAKHLMELLTLLLKIAYSKGSFNSEANVAQAAFYIMGNLVQNTPHDSSGDVFKHFFSGIFQLLTDSFNNAHFSSLNEQETYQGYLATIISSCCSSEKIKMNFEQLSSVYGLIKQTFINRQCIYEEGLIACSSLAFASPESFLSVLKDFVSFLIIGLNSFNEISLCSFSITCTSDLILALQNQFTSYLPQFIPVIFNILNDENCDKFLKTKCFIVLSDIFSISTMTESYNYYQKAMEVATNAMIAAKISPKEDDEPEIIEYFSLLRERIVELLTCIINFLSDYNKKNEFECYLPQTMDFVNTICQQKYCPTICFLTDSLGLIGDFCKEYKGKMRKYLQKPVLSYIFETLKNVKNERTTKLFEWANDIIIITLTWGRMNNPGDDIEKYLQGIQMVVALMQKNRDPIN